MGLAIPNGGTTALTHLCVGGSALAHGATKGSTSLFQRWACEGKDSPANTNTQIVNRAHMIQYYNHIMIKSNDLIIKRNQTKAEFGQEALNKMFLDHETHMKASTLDNITSLLGYLLLLFSNLCLCANKIDIQDLCRLILMEEISPSREDFSCRPQGKVSVMLLIVSIASVKEKCKNETTIGRQRIKY